MHSETNQGLHRTLLGVAGITAASGAVQLATPGRVLRWLGCEDSPATRQGFATVGMFMVVVGGSTLQGLLNPSTAATSPAAFWTAVQKFGAASAVTAGVRRRVFARPALLVAANDLASGILALLWLSRQRRLERTP